MSAIVCAGALLLAGKFYGYDFYVPLAAALAVAAAVTWFRLRGLSSGLPEPYGRGRASSIDAKSAARSGILIALGGILSVVAVLGSVFVLGVWSIALIFGLMAGLPLEELVFFTLVARLEGASKTRIYFVTKETGKDEDVVLVKTVEMSPSPARG